MGAGIDAGAVVPAYVLVWVLDGCKMGGVVEARIGIDSGGKTAKGVKLRIMRRDMPILMLPV